MSYTGFEQYTDEEVLQVATELMQPLVVELAKRLAEFIDQGIQEVKDLKEEVSDLTSKLADTEEDRDKLEQECDDALAEVERLKDLLENPEDAP